jgi:hypothetical protein
MGLDAHVCCDCFERGLFRTPPPPGCHLSIDKDGSLICDSDELEALMAFDRWQQSEACEHEVGRLVFHHIGNIALVAGLREELERWPERFSIILSRVIDNGIHGGDFITAADVPKLSPEVAALAGVRCCDPDMERFMRDFETQMKELVSAALNVHKHIVFCVALVAFTALCYRSAILAECLKAAENRLARDWPLGAIRSRRLPPALLRLPGVADNAGERQRD